ncbi:flagellar cap protein FliD N-terminal domain-containing protein [Bacillus sp. T3]|uniref:flagellar cap protein FliD N-terminal domain-containing protein n=1 Tax=Bacillus sp. T3 TaxID=467262 RepID=UPI002981BD39|nr:flagellar cap protein FliD N-terminal domain-containing protein [Bacillus sp. T3]
MSTVNNNTLRVTGLASGMNTDEIVEKLVTAQSARLNKMIQSKTIATWKSDSYRDINKKLDEFRKSMESLRLQSTFNKQKVTSSDTRVEVSTAGTSTRTDFVISEAKPATSAKPALVSFNSMGAIVNADTTVTLNNMSIALTKDMTLDQVITEINKYTTNTTDPTKSTNVKAANVGGSLVLTSTGTGDTAKIDLTAGVNNLGIAETHVTWNKGGVWLYRNR